MSNDKVQYPKYLYHHSEQPALVLDAEEHELFGDEWKESPADTHQDEIDDAANNHGQSSHLDVDLLKLKKADLLAHALEHHELELDPALTNAKLAAAIEEARAKAGE